MGWELKAIIGVVIFIVLGLVIAVDIRPQKRKQGVLNAK